MQLEILDAVGNASTQLAAFDDALRQVGLHDVNLITLSSVIPPSCELIERATTASVGQIGDRLYCVLASHTAAPDEGCYAGLAWAQDEDGAGIFLEEHGSTRLEVERALTSGLSDMRDSRSGRNWRTDGLMVTGSGGSHTPHAAIVIAVYDREGWPWSN